MAAPNDTPAPPPPSNTIRLTNDQGDAIEASPEQAATLLGRGYRPESADEETNRLATDVQHETYGGITGKALALGYGALSGATLGLSDVGFAAIGAGDAVKGYRDENPLSSGIGTVAGSLATGFAGEGSMLARTPAGYLARFAGEGIEAGRAAGGVRGALQVAAASGLEGAAQNGGMYLSDVALGDRDLTAEGMAGALGHGFAFGAVAGGATYGIEQGTLSARRMFARLAEGGQQAGTDAANAFDRTTDQVLQAHDDTAAIAQKRLDEIRSMKAQAQTDRLYADSELANAKLARSRQPAAPEVPGEPAIEPPTSAPGAAPAPELPASPPAAIAPAPAPASTTAAAPGSLEDQLGQMKAQLDSGASLQDLNAQRVTGKPPVLAPEIQAEEQKLTSALSDYQQRRGAVDDWIANLKNPRKSVEADPHAALSIAQGGSPLIRARLTKALDEDVFVEQSGGQLRTIGKGEHTLDDITPNTRILARSNGDKFSHGAVLDDAYNDAIERAKLAETPAAQDAALHEAADIEQQTHNYVRANKPENGAVIDRIEATRAAVGRTGYHAAFARAERGAMEDAELAGAKWDKADWSRPRPSNTVEDAHVASKVLGDYEKSAATLTEAVGDAAPPAAQDAAQGYRAAENEADRKAMERTTRAVDDHVNDQMMKGPVYRSPTDRIADAKAQRLEADAKLGQLKVQEADAKAAVKAAPKPPKGKGSSKGAETPKLQQEVGTAPKLSRFERAKDLGEKIGTGLEIAGMAGIPGVPKPSDIPVIGPLLGMYLKFRALTGKLAGRVAATGEARAAVLAAQTRNRVAQSVDRLLGTAQKSAAAARTVAVRSMPIAQVLTKQIFDDGGPEPTSDSKQDLAKVRAREAIAAAANPQQVIDNVRKQLGSITDPDLIAAAEQHQVALMQYLAANAPKGPPPQLMGGDTWKPSPSQADTFATRLAVAADPLVALHQVEQGAISPAAAQTLQAVYPKIFAEMQQRLVNSAAQIDTSIPYQQQLRLAILFDVALDRLSVPATMAQLQAVHAASPARATTGPASPAQNAPPTPSVAGPVDLGKLYMTAADQRFARR